MQQVNNNGFVLYSTNTLEACALLCLFIHQNCFDESSLATKSAHKKHKHTHMKGGEKKAHYGNVAGVMDLVIA